MIRALPKPIPRELNPPYPDYPYFEGFAEHPFRPELTAFHVPNAWFLAECCMLSYGGGALCRSAFAAAELAPQAWRAELVDADPAAALLATNGTTAVLAFRGTRVDKLAHFVEDGLSDAHAIPVPDGAGAFVHPGFLERLDQIWDLIDRRLRPRGEPGSAAKPLWITGHSMGGAIALLAADRAARTPGYAVRGVYTFGCPKTGDKEFVRRLESRMKGNHAYRLVNHADLVPHLPPIRQLEHAGALAWIDGEGHLQYPAGESAYRWSRPRVWKDWPRWLLGFVTRTLKRGLVDHAPIHYGTRLFNLSS